MWKFSIIFLGCLISPISCWHVPRFSCHSIRLMNEWQGLIHSLQSNVLCRNFIGLWLSKHWKIRIAHRQWHSKLPKREGNLITKRKTEGNISTVFLSVKGYCANTIYKIIHGCLKIWNFSLSVQLDSSRLSAANEWDIESNTRNSLSMRAFVLFSRNFMHTYITTPQELSGWRTHANEQKMSTKIPLVLKLDCNDTLLFRSFHLFTYHKHKHIPHLNEMLDTRPIHLRWLEDRRVWCLFVVA